MVIGKREQKNPEQKLCAQVSMLCRQKLLGYAIVNMEWKVQLLW